MGFKNRLALLGGSAAITFKQPHHLWPPKPLQEELDELATQRIKDIGIRGCVGPIKEFEEAFRSFLENKIKYSVSFNSGTSALLACYVALGIKHGDEVIGPALTFHAALSPLFILGARPVLVDIDEKTRCIDSSKIEAAITERTKAITVVHQWGHPANLEQIMQIAKKHDLYVIEDCSHAHGSRYKDQLCGTFGDVAAFSLQTNKAIFAGEGGILVTNSSDYHDRAVALGHYRERCKESVVNEDIRQYGPTGFGLKLRLSPFNAIVAKHSLAHFPEIKKGRHRSLRYFNKCLQSIPFMEPHYVSPDADMGAWYGFKPLYHSERLQGLDRQMLIRALQAEGMDIDVPSGSPLYHYKLYQKKNNVIFSDEYHLTNPSCHLPIAEKVHARALSLPTFDNWPHSQAIIDQYCIAIDKVATNVDELLSFSRKLGEKDASVS